MRIREQWPAPILFLGFLLLLPEAPARALWLEMRLTLPPPWLIPVVAVLGCVMSVLLLALTRVLQERAHRRKTDMPSPAGLTGCDPLRHAALTAMGVTALRLLMGAAGGLDTHSAGVPLRLWRVAIPEAVWRSGSIALVSFVLMIAVLGRLFPKSARECGLPRAVRLFALPVAAVLLALPQRALRDVIHGTDVGAFTGLMTVAAVQALLLSALAAWLLQWAAVSVSGGQASDAPELDVPAPASARPEAGTLETDKPEVCPAAVDSVGTDTLAACDGTPHPADVSEGLPRSLLIPLAVVLSALLLWLSLPRALTPETMLTTRGRAALVDAARLTQTNRPYAAWTYALRAQADADLLAAYALMTDILYVHEGRTDPDRPRIANEVVPAIDAALALEPGNPAAQALRAVAVLMSGQQEQGIATLKGLLSATAVAPEAKWMAAASLLPVTKDPEVARYLALYGMAPYSGTHEPVRPKALSAATSRLAADAKAAVLSAGPAHLESLWLFKRFDTLLSDAGTVLRLDSGNPAANRFAALADLDRGNGSANFDVAMAALDRLAVAHDGNDEVIRFILETAMRAGRPDVALRIAEPWYVRHPDSPVAAGCYAWALMVRSAGQPFGDDDRMAQKLLSDAIAAGGDPGFLHYHMAETRLKEGAFEEANAEILAWNAAESSDNTAESGDNTESGDNADASGDNADESANAAGELMLQPEPASDVGARDRLYFLAYAYSRHIGEAAADKALVSCTEAWPAFANLVAGIRAQADGNPEKARQHLEAAWAGGIMIPRCALVLGVSLYECALTSGSEVQMDRAERMLRRSTADDPESPTAWYALGGLLERRQSYDEAYAAYARASLLSPDDTHRQDQLGIGPHARRQMGAIAPLLTEVK